MPKTILIVDDNAYIRQALCQVFKREADFEVCDQAENGKEAIAKAVELRPDLIVLDLSMPIWSRRGPRTQTGDAQSATDHVQLLR